MISFGIDIFLHFTRANSGTTNIQQSLLRNNEHLRIHYELSSGRWWFSNLFLDYASLFVAVIDT